MNNHPFIPGLNSEISDKSSDCGSITLDIPPTRAKNSKFEKMRSSLKDTLFQTEKSRSFSVIPTSKSSFFNEDDKHTHTPTSDIAENSTENTAFERYSIGRNMGPKRSSAFFPSETRSFCSIDRSVELGEERPSASHKGNASIVLTPTERGTAFDDNHEGFGSRWIGEREHPGSIRQVEESKYEDTSSIDNGTFENRSIHSYGSPRDSEKRSSIFLRDIDSEMEEIKRDLKIEDNSHIHFIKGNFYDKYQEEKIIGEGASGTVKKIIKRDTGQALAVKVVHYRDDLEMIYLIVNEFKNQKKLNHKNIIKVYDLYIDYFKKKIYTVMELAECREMFDVLRDLGHYSEAVASGIFKQILACISYLHLNGVCHRDLKPNNILVSEDGKTIKIIDFNVSKFLESKKTKFSYLSTQNHKMWTYTGTIAFTAPEVFTDTEYTEAVDMWSAGVVLYTMLCGYQPFQAETVSELIELIKIGKYDLPADPWDNISKQAKSLVKHLLDVNAKTRYSPAQALMHPWIANCGKVSNTNIPSTQYHLRRNCQRNIARKNTYNVPNDRSRCNNQHNRSHKKHKDHHIHEHKPILKMAMKEDILKNQDNILNAAKTEMIQHLQPKRGKTGPEGFQSFGPVFPLKLERSFSFSALEDEEEDIDDEEEDENDDEEGDKLNALCSRNRRRNSNVLSPCSPSENILGSIASFEKSKQSPPVSKDTFDKENIMPAKKEIIGEREKVEDVEGMKVQNKEKEAEYKNKEGITWLENKYCNEPSKAQD